MPIFEYACQDCGAVFEKLVRNGGTADVTCPSCGEKHVQQQLSRFAAHSRSGLRSEPAPQCPSGGPCRNPGMCGLN